MSLFYYVTFQKYGSMHLKPQLAKYIENRMGVREGWKGGGGVALLLRSPPTNAAQRLDLIRGKV